MKKTLFAIGFLTILKSLNAQNTEGVILYEETINMHRMIPDSMLKQMKGMIPETRTSQMELYFKDDESLYKPLEDLEETQGGGGGMGFRMSGAKSETYRNLATEKSIQQMEMMGKKVLIEDSLKVFPWKITKENQKIMGYDCTKAVLTDSVRGRGRDSVMTKRIVTAWFAESIPMAFGPNEFGTLPGCILAIDINNGERVMVAKKVELKKVKADEVKAPTKGEKMTRKEFDEKMKEFMKKNRGTRVIRQG